jgi:hypothetical protein
MVAVSGELQLLGCPWKFLRMKIQFCSWKGGGGVPASLFLRMKIQFRSWKGGSGVSVSYSPWRRRLGDLCLGCSGYRLIVDVSSCNFHVAWSYMLCLHAFGQGMFMSVVFIYCIIRGFSGVVINFTHLLIQYCVQQGIEKKAFPPQSQSAHWAAGSL